MGRTKSLQKVAREEMKDEVIKRRVAELKRLLNREEELQDSIRQVRKQITETETGKRDYALAVNEESKPMYQVHITNRRD